MNQLFHVILGQIRGLLVFFDSVVYGFIPILYKLMLYLANIDLVKDNIPVQNLIQRIYILVGVFMLFKLSFSVMNYIIDPESFSDKTKGFTNLVKRVVIAIVLLVSIPWIFQEAYVVQGKILVSGIVPRLVLGEAASYDNYEDGSGNDYIESTMEESARDVQFLLYGPFYSINYNAKEFEACKPDPSNSSKHILGTSGMASDEACLTAVAQSMDKDDTVIASGVKLKDFFRYDSDREGEPTDERKFTSFGGLASWTTNDGDFVINYYPIVSFLCGGYLVFLLLSFCIDVAARIIRLLFLQILSPIAVISSVDPTTSGDRLKEWAKECFKTWASLFLRLSIIFLIIQLVRVITNTVYSGNNGFTVEGFGNENGVNVWIYIFLLLGIFSAAKKIPELIEKATGFKMSGDLELNPFKAFGSNAAFMAMSGAAFGTVGGALSGGLAGFTTSLNNGHSIPRSLLSGIGGISTGGVTGLARGGRAGGTKGWDSGLQSGGRIARRMDIREATGGIKGLPGMVIDRARDVVGAPTTYESMENNAKRFDEVGDAIKTMNDRATDQLSKKSFAWKAVQAQKEIYAQQLKNGAISQDDYVRRINAAYQDEQRLIAGYIDSNGKDLGRGQTQSQDDVLEMNRKTLKKVVEDSKVREFDAKKGEFGKILELDKDNIQTSWSDIGSDVNGSSKLFKSSAEREALSIRSQDSYNDARDRDQAIHNTRLDAHQKH